MVTTENINNHHKKPTKGSSKIIVSEYQTGASIQDLSDRYGKTVEEITNVCVRR